MLRRLLAIVIYLAPCLSAGAAELEDLALAPAPIHTPPPAKYADDRRVFQGIPSLERAPGGRLWASWYGGGVGEGPENYVMIVTSSDDGRTWSDIQFVIDPLDTVRAFDPALWVDPTGRLWLFWAQGWAFFDGRVGVWAMTGDDPDSEKPHWSTPRRLFNGVMMNKPTVLSSGE